MFADVNQNSVDISPDIRAWCLDSRNDLWNDLQPGINVNSGEPAAHCMADVIVISILEPQSEQSQRVLKSVLIAQRDRLDETCENI